MKTSFTVEEMLNAYKTEVFYYLKEEFNLTEEESVLALDMTSFEEHFLSNHHQFDNTEPIIIARIVHGKWSKE